MKFKTKPVTIEAIRYDGDFGSIHKMQTAWPGFKEASHITIFPEWTSLKIKTLEGDHIANIGDWIIRGTLGEFYPCKPKAFENKYEEIKEIHIGDFVKVRKNGERFWCQVLEMNGQNIKARVDNEVIGQEFGLDDILNFTSADVIDCKKLDAGGNNENT